MAPSSELPETFFAKDPLLAELIKAQKGEAQIESLVRRIMIRDNRSTPEHPIRRDYSPLKEFYVSADSLIHKTEIAAKAPEEIVQALFKMYMANRATLLAHSAVEDAVESEIDIHNLFAKHRIRVLGNPVLNAAEGDTHRMKVSLKDTIEEVIHDRVKTPEQFKRIMLTAAQRHASGQWAERFEGNFSEMYANVLKMAVAVRQVEGESIQLYPTVRAAQEDLIRTLGTLWSNLAQRHAIRMQEKGKERFRGDTAPLVEAQIVKIAPGLFEGFYPLVEPQLQSTLELLSTPIHGFTDIYDLRAAKLAAEAGAQFFRKPPALTGNKMRGESLSLRFSEQEQKAKLEELARAQQGIEGLVREIITRGSYLTANVSPMRDFFLKAHNLIEPTVASGAKAPQEITRALAKVYVENRTTLLRQSPVWEVVAFEIEMHNLFARLGVDDVNKLIVAAGELHMPKVKLKDFIEQIVSEQVTTAEQLERVLLNASYRYVSEQWSEPSDGNFSEMLANVFRTAAAKQIYPTPSAAQIAVVNSLETLWRRQARLHFIYSQKRAQEISINILNSFTDDVEVLTSSTFKGSGQFNPNHDPLPRLQRQLAVLAHPIAGVSDVEVLTKATKDFEERVQPEKINPPVPPPPPPQSSLRFSEQEQKAKIAQLTLAQQGVEGLVREIVTRGGLFLKGEPVDNGSSPIKEFFYKAHHLIEKGVNGNAKAPEAVAQALVKVYMDNRTQLLRSSSVEDAIIVEIEMRNLFDRLGAKNVDGLMRAAAGNAHIPAIQLKDFIERAVREQVTTSDQFKRVVLNASHRYASGLWMEASDGNFADMFANLLRIAATKRQVNGQPVQLYPTANAAQVDVIESLGKLWYGRARIHFIRGLKTDQGRFQSEVNELLNDIQQVASGLEGFEESTQQNSTDPTRRFRRISAILAKPIAGLTHDKMVREARLALEARVHPSKINPPPNGPNDVPLPGRFSFFRGRAAEQSTVGRGGGSGGSGGNGGGGIGNGMDFPGGDAPFNPGDTGQQGPRQWKDMAKRFWQNEGIHLTSQSAAFYVAMGAVAVFDCLALNSSKDPMCMRNLMDGVTSFQTMLSLGLFMGTQYGLAKKYPMMSPNLGMAAAMIVQDIGARAYMQIKACNDMDNPKIDPGRREQMAQMCESAFEVFAVNNLLGSFVPSLANNAFGLMVLAGINGASKALTKVVDPVSKEVVRDGIEILAVRAGMGGGARFAVNVGAFVVFFGASAVFNRYGKPVWDETIRTTFAADQYFSFFNPITSWLGNFLWSSGALNARRAAEYAYNPAYTLSPGSAGTVTLASEESYLEELYNWRKRDFTPAWIKPDSEGKEACSQGGWWTNEKICRYEKPFTDVVNTYAALRKNYRNYRISEWSMAYSEWARAYDAFYQMYMTTRQVYDLAARKLIENYRKTHRWEFPEDFVSEVKKITSGADTDMMRAFLPFAATAEHRAETAKNDDEVHGQASGHLPPLGRATTPHLEDYLIASMACGPAIGGPTSHGLKNWFLMGADFQPPRLVRDLRSICSQGTVETDPLERDPNQTSNIYKSIWTMPARKRHRGEESYKGLLAYIAEHFDRALLVDDTPLNQPPQATGFNDWWVHNLAVPAAKVWEKYREQYNGLLSDMLIPALVDKRFSTCTDENGNTITSRIKYRHLPSTFVRMCKEERVRMADLGESVRYRRMRLAKGLVQNIRDELKLYLETLELILLKQTPPSLRQARQRNFRMLGRALLQTIDRMAQKLSGDSAFAVMAEGFKPAMNNLYSMFGFSESLNDLMKLDQDSRVMAYQQLKTQQAIVSGPFLLEKQRRDKGMAPEQRALEDQKLTLATLFARTYDLYQDLLVYRAMVDGIGGMPMQLDPIEPSPSWLSRVLPKE